jgi:hypothetical protein
MVDRIMWLVWFWVFLQSSSAWSNLDDESPEVVERGWAPVREVRPEKWETGDKRGQGEVSRDGVRW